MHIRKHNGFTLIELLVVIAIIGILSAVVLASLNASRSKGSDASIKANLNSVTNQAAIFLSDNNNVYGGFDDGAGAATSCPAAGVAGTSVFHNSTIENAIASALVDSSGGTATCLSTDAAYAIAVSRPADVAANTSTYWCIDSSGEHCGVNSNALTGVSCGSCVTSQ